MTNAWPPNHVVVSSSIESSHFVYIMLNVRSVSDLSRPRLQLMDNNWVNFSIPLEQLNLTQAFS